MKAPVFAVAMALAIAGNLDALAVPVPSHHEFKGPSDYSGQPVNKSQEQERRQRQAARRAAKKANEHDDA